MVAWGKVVSLGEGPRHSAPRSRSPSGGDDTVDGVDVIPATLILHASLDSAIPEASLTKSPSAPGGAQRRQRSRAILWLRRLAVPLTVLAIVPLLLTELGYFTIHDLVGSAIPDAVYFSHAAFGLTAGHVPYAPGFMTAPDQNLTFLYPPLTLLLILPPVLAGTHFTVGLSVEMLLVALGGSALLGRAGKRAGIAFPLGAVVFLLIIAVGPAALTRVDAAQGLLVAGSALALTRGRERTAVALVAAAVLIKETAVLAAVPVALWCLWPHAGEPVGVALRRGSRNVLVGAAPPLVIFLGFLIWSGGGELSAALSSVHRGLEVESLPASVAIAASWLVPVHAYLGHLASWQIRSGDASLLAAGFSVLGALALLAGSARFCWLRRRPATMIAFAVAAGLCATPVLSPQYVLELLPVVAVAAALETSGTDRELLLFLALTIALLTQAEFPYLFGEVAKLAPAGLIPLLARNLALLVLAAVLARRATSRQPVPALRTEANPA